MAGTVDSTGNTLTALAVGLLAQVVQQQQQLQPQATASSSTPAVPTATSSNPEDNR